MDKRYRILLLNWAALLLLLALTAGTALFDLGRWNSVLNLAIAVSKAILVALVFMRLWQAHALVRIASATGLAALAVLFALSSTDYLTRETVRAPWQAPRAVPARLGSDPPPGQPVRR